VHFENPIRRAKPLIYKQIAGLLRAIRKADRSFPVAQSLIASMGGNPLAEFGER
jgi:hypothetical protein